MVKNLPEMWETWVWSLDWEDPLEKGTQYPGLENSLDRETWQTTVHGVTKSRTCLSDFQIHCVLATQLCLTLCNSMDYSPPGSSIHGILQARTLEWVAISFCIKYITMYKINS